MRLAGKASVPAGGAFIVLLPAGGPFAGRFVSFWASLQMCHQLLPIVFSPATAATHNVASPEVECSKQELQFRLSIGCRFFVPTLSRSCDRFTPRTGHRSLHEEVDISGKICMVYLIAPGGSRTICMT